MNGASPSTGTPSGPKWKSSASELREAHKSVDILVSEDSDGADATVFVGYDPANLQGLAASCIDLVEQDENAFLVLDQTPFMPRWEGKPETPDRSS